MKTPWDPFFVCFNEIKTRLGAISYHGICNENTMVG